MMWFSPRMVLLWLGRWVTSFGGNVPPKNPKWAWNIILKLTRGSSDFDEIWQGDAVQPSGPFRPLKISNFENPRWRRPPSWKIEKSPYLGRSSSDFDEIWPDDTVRPSWPFRSLKIWNFKNPKWRRPPSWKIKNHHMSAEIGAILSKFCTVKQFDLLVVSDR